MFDPRKLIPLSMEDCSAPMAVITEITEKTPIVMPIIVNAARSLFAPNEASAILTISLKRILVHHRERRGFTEQNRHTSLAAVDSSKFFIISACCLFCGYLF